MNEEELIKKLQDALGLLKNMSKAQHTIHDNYTQTADSLIDHLIQHTYKLNELEERVFIVEETLVKVLKLREKRKST